MRNEQILLVDDDKDILAMLEKLLEKEGFKRVATATTGKQAISRIEAASYDLIVLDVMLPDTDGFELCRQIRRHTSVPILFLTARSGNFDKLMGLVNLRNIGYKFVPPRKEAAHEG
ncbi:response regulator [Paenibacillus sp. SN-8-1]|uniref:response regulator n=1 Tax=Paenibacillus sp. SN-8-1 TaxID=3435409 RepID=UPI003D9A9B94